jgi:hypothetical protein
MVGGCEDIKSAATGEQGVVLQLGGWVWGSKTSTIKYKFVMKCSKVTQTLTDSLDKWPKQQNIDIRFSAWNISWYRAGSLVSASGEILICSGTSGEIS